MRESSNSESRNEVDAAMILPPLNPRIVLTSFRSIAIVTVSYAGTALSFPMLLRYIEYERNEYDPYRSVTIGVFALICAIAWLWSVASILLSRR